MRPMDMKIGDFDMDGILEIALADRKGNDSGFYFAIISVDNIPDTGDGSETWTIETSGLDHTLSAAPENKWDVLWMEGALYFFSETEVSKVWWDGTAWQYMALDPHPAGSPVQAMRAVDLDMDGTMEAVGAIYDWGDDAQKSVVLIQDDGAGGLTWTNLFDISGYFDSRGAWGSAMGDICGDGYMDFVFGSRAGLTNAQIFKLSYKGGDITDPASYEFGVIDSGYAEEDGIWGELEIANVDDDPELEVLYTSTASYGGDLFNPASSAPVVVLDYVCECGGGETPEPPTTGIDQIDAVVDGYKLGQNFPNPFNPTTTITIEIPNDELVSLTVYNMLGHEVVTLVNQNLAKGEYQVTWDGKDNHGVAVPAGSYVYQLKAGDVTKIRKMTYMK
jgi:hypothetical protein